jgi:hypothetical protein
MAEFDVSVKSNALEEGHITQVSIQASWPDGDGGTQIFMIILEDVTRATSHDHPDWTPEPARQSGTRLLHIMFPIGDLNQHEAATKKVIKGAMKDFRVFYNKILRALEVTGNQHVLKLPRINEEKDAPKWWEPVEAFMARSFTLQNEVEKYLENKKRQEKPTPCFPMLITLDPTLPDDPGFVLTMSTGNASHAKVIPE